MTSDYTGEMNAKLPKSTPLGPFGHTWIFHDFGRWASLGPTYGPLWAQLISVLFVYKPQLTFLNVKFQYNYAANLINSYLL